MKGHNWGLCKKCGGFHKHKKWEYEKHPRKGKQSEFMKMWHKTNKHPLQGKTLSEETRKKRSISMKGKNKGKKRLDLIKRNKSKEHIMKVKKALTGRKHTKEHIENNSQVRRGIKRSKSAIKKFVETNKKNGLWERHSERLKKHNISKYCNSPSKPQKNLYLAIKKYFNNFKVICNYKVPKENGGHYYLDIAVPLLKLNIEYDGKYWHSKNKEKDAIRDNYLKSKKWGVVRIEGK